MIEKNGLIFVWHHPNGEAPDFDVPTLPNHESDQWLPWEHSSITIKTHSKEIEENVVDIAHFKPVHGTHVETFENEFDGHLAEAVPDYESFDLFGFGLSLGPNSAAT